MLAGRSFAGGNCGHSPLPMGGTYSAVEMLALCWIGSCLVRTGRAKGIIGFRCTMFLPCCIILFLSGFWTLLWSSQNLNDIRLVKGHTEQVIRAGVGDFPVKWGAWSWILSGGWESQQ